MPTGIYQHKQNQGFQKGHKHTEERKRKISKMLKGKSKSEKARRNMSEAQKRAWKKGKYANKKGVYYKGENHWNWQGGKMVIKCLKCGKERKYFPNQAIDILYCEKHKGESTKGEKNHNWKGGINLENERIRHSLEWQVWRNEVYKRDNWFCRLCKKKCRKDIIAHHIKLFSDFPELRFSIDNGITLCRSCHLKLHKKILLMEKLEKIKKEK